MKPGKVEKLSIKITPPEVCSVTSSAKATPCQGFGDVKKSAKKCLQKKKG
jgi:hypothetical protein